MLEKEAKTLEINSTQIHFFCMKREMCMFLTINSNFVCCYHLPIVFLYQTWVIALFGSSNRRYKKIPATLFNSRRAIRSIGIYLITCIRKNIKLNKHITGRFCNLMYSMKYNETIEFPGDGRSKEVSLKRETWQLQTGTRHHPNICPWRKLDRNKLLNILRQSCYIQQTNIIRFKHLFS